MTQGQELWDKRRIWEQREFGSSYPAFSYRLHQLKNSRVSWWWGWDGSCQFPYRMVSLSQSRLRRRVFSHRKRMMRSVKKRRKIPPLCSVYQSSRGRGDISMCSSAIMLSMYFMYSSLVITASKLSIMALA